MGKIIQSFKSLLPNKMSAAQRTQVKLKKLDQRAGKTAIKEVGRTIRSIASQTAAARIAERKMDTDAMKAANASENAIKNAIEKYNSIITALPETDGQPGKSGDKSTSEVGGGSIINGG